MGARHDGSRLAPGRGPGVPRRVRPRRPRPYRRPASDSTPRVAFHRDAVRDHVRRRRCLHGRGRRRPPRRRRRRLRRDLRSAPPHPSLRRGRPEPGPCPEATTPDRPGCPPRRPHRCSPGPGPRRGHHPPRLRHRRGRRGRDHRPGPLPDHRPTTRPTPDGVRLGRSRRGIPSLCVRGGRPPCGRRTPGRRHLPPPRPQPATPSGHSRRQPPQRARPAAPPIRRDPHDGPAPRRCPVRPVDRGSHTRSGDHRR